MAAQDDWLVAYDAVYRASPAAADVLCPNCGRQTLRLVFTGDVARGIGYASFWCETCLEGIHVSRAPIPEGAVVRPIDLPAEQRTPEIPDYTLAPD